MVRQKKPLTDTPGRAPSLHPTPGERPFGGMGDGELTFAALLLLESKTAVTKQDALDEDVLDRGEFTKRTAALAAALALILGRQESAAASRVARLLNRDWAAMTAGQRGAALREAARELAQIPQGVERDLQRQAVAAALEMDRRARVAGRAQNQLDVRAASTEAEKQKAMRFARPTPDFIVNDYKRRGVAFAGAAAVAIGVGLRQGESSSEIAARVQGRATAALGRDAYLQGVAGTVLNRARTSSLLNIFRESGTQFIQVLSARDERTCFPAGTQVLLSSGERKAIESIQVGDQVITRRGRPRRVLNTFKKQATEWARIEFATGAVIYSTIDHEFATEGGGWTRADRLRGTWVESIRPKGDASVHDMPPGIQRPAKQRESIQELFPQMPLEKVEAGKLSTMRQADSLEAVASAEALLRGMSPSSLHLELLPVWSSVPGGSSEGEGREVLLPSMLSSQREAHFDRVGGRAIASVGAASIHRRGANQEVGCRLPGSRSTDRGGRRGLLALHSPEEAPGQEAGPGGSQGGICGSSVERVRGSARSPEREALDFGSVEVVAVTIERREDAAYDIEVDEDHSYVVGPGFVVHNCEKCLFMHGTIFPVPQTFDLMDRVAALRSPFAIASANPFLREGVTANGDRVIYVPGGDGARLTLGTVIESRRGQVDRVSDFDRTPNPIELLSLGIGLPPYHPICRCVPVIA